MKNDLLSDYFLNEYIPLHPSYTRDDLLKEFRNKAQTSELALPNNDQEELFFEAFTHKSFAHEAKTELTNNERLEFLGDSVLQLVISETLLAMYPEAKEGKLSKLRSSIVNESSLSSLARRFQLQRLIMLGRGEFGEKGYDKDSLLANCFESYLGALYISSGYEKTKAVILSILATAAAQGEDLLKMEAIEDFDAKSRLQEELVKRFQETPKYVCADVENENGKERLFRISLSVKGETLGELVHKSKKKGMQALARQVLADIQSKEI